VTEVALKIRAQTDNTTPPTDLRGRRLHHIGVLHERLFAIVPPSGLRHFRFDEAYDNHQDASTYTATGDVREDGANVKTTGSRGRSGARAARHQHVEELAANPASDQAQDRVAGSAEAKLFQHGSSGIATGSATDELNEQTCDVHIASSIWVVRAPTHFHFARIIILS
jgi:hypothetical protein